MFDSRSRPITQIAAEKSPAETCENRHTSHDEIGAGQLKTADALEICRHKKRQTAEGERIGGVAQDGSGVDRVAD